MRLDQIGTPRPGFYETHTENGVTWRSTPQVRSFSDSIIAPKVSHFIKTLQSEPTSTKTPYKRVYKLATSWLEITQQPWDDIPTLHIIEEQKPVRIP